MSTTIYVAPDGSETRGRMPCKIARNGGTMGIAAATTVADWQALGGSIRIEPDPVVLTPAQAMAVQAAAIAEAHPEVPGAVARVAALIGYAAVDLGADLPTERLATFAELGAAILADDSEEAYRLFARGRLDWDVVLSACRGDYQLAYELAPYLAALDAE